MGAYVFVAIEKSEYVCDYDEDCAYVRACSHHGRLFVCLFVFLVDFGELLLKRWQVRQEHERLMCW